ncbi:MAG: dimethyl sulfoxide reductase anchor subunit [Paracoccaceae bacterium]|jgi:DMSO reductase anchor subunit|nr:dimethyl sulfoxide reductase anchor subunit [Paracoccaceae bacterium]MDP7186840.1 dimethyl sulfoxide reductase anchor subunit [Paracoccaceae bacterium]
MHPAPSVIFFTVSSGLGFGLLAWLGTGNPAVNGLSAFVMYFLGYGFAVGGLLSSVFHLANKKNAIKAFSQWRTSWLSREAVLSVITLLTVAPYAIGRIFFDTTLETLGLIGSALCVVTVLSTSMIYAQLKTVPRWNNGFTPLLFVLYMISGGALFTDRVGIAVYLLIALGILQVLAWRDGDNRTVNNKTDMGTATGLGRIGKVRQYEPPHTGQNYLLKEMAYQVARKHVLKLRLIAFVAAFLLPILALMAFADTPSFGAPMALVFHLLGVLASRWLFFAEARHAVANYYGR